MDLNFDCNNIGTEGATKLGEGVSHLQKLTIFNLSLINDRIEVDGAAKLIEGVSKLLNLTSLNLNF